ncbi:MAG: ABC transporter ATP-binding protein [Pseudanabaenaceae cyanobacterium bins.68]|nr:ABC transporter ATP-binding protein [Pseudanabaenaceae cyanobacterium bins.68]
MKSIVKETRGSATKGLVEVEDLTIAFMRNGHSTKVLESVYFRIEPGEFVCLLGPSGCGKSTILNAIAGFIKPTHGHIYLDRQHIEKPDADRGFVFQQYSLLPWKTTFENVEFGLKIRGVPKQKRKEIVEEYLNRVGLFKHRNAYPHQLSGGMQQRATIVRSLVGSPSVLLMDEPFAALDAQTRRMMQELLLEIWSELKLTVIFVTHDIEEAVFLGDRVFVMGVNPGRIMEDIRIPLQRPRHLDDIMTPHFSQISRQVFHLIRGETLKILDNE